jgi:predicted DNA-binding ribbon-helix-helix protein
MLTRLGGDGEAMKSAIIKRSIVIAGHKTSVSLEDAFWQALREIAHERGEHSSQLVASIDKDRQFANLSSAVRVFVLEHYRDQCQREKAVSLALEAEKLSPRS